MPKTSKHFVVGFTCRRTHTVRYVADDNPEVDWEYGGFGIVSNPLDAYFFPAEKEQLEYPESPLNIVCRNVSREFDDVKIMELSVSYSLREVKE